MLPIVALRNDIAKWDGNSADDIAKIYDQYSDHKSLLSQLIKCARNRSLEIGATWLIKRHIENMGQTGSAVYSGVLALMPSLEHWEAKLTILQCLPHIKVSDTHRKSVELFTKQCIAAENKFVRAWGYSGFIELARQYPKYQQEANKMVEIAMLDEAPSVQARIRNVMSDRSSQAAT